MTFRAVTEISRNPLDSSSDSTDLVDEERHPLQDLADDGEEEQRAAAEPVREGAGQHRVDHRGHLGSRHVGSV